MGPKKVSKKTNGNSSEDVEGYCVKCKEKRVMKDTKKIKTKNGRNALSGVCTKCGTKMMRFTK